MQAKRRARDGDEQGKPKRTRVRLLDLHVRFEVAFILHDPRMTRLSDGGMALYLRLEALAASERREILPLDYDVQELAWRFRREPAEIEASLAELGEGRRPLVVRVSDGRIRIVGLQAKHPQIRWKPDPLIDATDTDGQQVVPVGDHMVDSCDQVDISYNCVGTEQKRTEENPPLTPPGNAHQLDHVVDACSQVSSEAAVAVQPFATQPTARPSDEAYGDIASSSSPEARVFADLTANWNGTNDTKRLTATALARSRLEDSGPLVLAHVLEISGDRRVERPWAVLQKRLLDKKPPSDPSVERAKTLLRDGSASRSAVAHIGAVFTPGPSG